MDEDLFERQSLRGQPLPARLRPRNWDGLIGHEVLVRKLRGKPAHSMVLYGPPGSGKTTFASVFAREADAPFKQLSAVSAGVKEVREAIEEGRTRFRTVGRGIILFLDEIHRFSKSQQDALLEAVEAGWITLIGATTENPSFEVVGPLLSRCQVYRIEPFDDAALNRILERALAEDAEMAHFTLSDAARPLLLEAAGGDARRLLAGLELAAQTARARAPRAFAENPAPIEILAEDAKLALEGRVRDYDKAGENHYDMASAFIKSLRGSDPDAALLYMAAMLEGGEDPLFIARRMIIFAAEDVGNAYPQALSIAVAAFQAVERIGLPEGRIVLGQAATLLAAAPKSNAAYLAMDAALAAVRGRAVRAPNHLRNAPTKTHRAEGAGQGYKYPHDFPGGYVEQQYLPDGFEKAQYYFPTEHGSENRFRERLRLLRPARKYD